MRTRTLGRWIGRMGAVAAVIAGASLGAALTTNAEPNDMTTVAEAAADTDEASPDAHEWQ